MSGCSSNRNYHMSNQESWDVIGTRSLAKPVVLTSCSYLMTCESARWVSTPSPTMVPFSRTEIVLLASVGDICLFDFKTHVNGRSKKKGVPATGCCGVYSDMDSHCYQPSHWQHWYGLLGLVGILILELDPREIVPIKVDDLPIQHDHGNHGSSATRGDSHHHLQKKKHATPCWGIGHLCLALLLGHLVSNPTGGCRLLITCRKVVGGSGETSEDIRKKPEGVSDNLWKS